MKKMTTCMAKTHLSLSQIRNQKESLTYKGAGAISLMPGTASGPAYRRVNVDVETGKIKDVC